jgi:hypothetical protein
MSSQKRKFTGHKTDKGLVIETEQDVTHIIEANKKEYNEDDGKWGDDIFDNRIARIPDTVTDHLNQLGIMRGYHVLDQKEFMKFLMKPENKYLRTKRGRF